MFPYLIHFRKNATIRPLPLGDSGNFLPTLSRRIITSVFERRKASRRRMVLPVKVYVEQSTHLAHTVDITGAGARVAGLRAEMKVGATIELQRGPRKAKFVVRWIKNLDANEVQIGIECREPQEKFWGVDLAQQDQAAKREMDALMTLLTRSKAATS